ncbi:MAG: hypothetical protein IPN62_00035 [Flavobacteriales bacterium]|nr:hypothetical protein [Flavobacteriales bacterium]
MITASDGALVYTGTSSSSDGDLTSNQGGTDAWLFRIDNTGDIEWSTTLGGSASDAFLAFKATDDLGYIAVGQSSSSDGDLPGNNGGGDVWVVKFGPDPVGVREASNSVRPHLREPLYGLVGFLQHVHRVDQRVGGSWMDKAA